MKRFRFFTVLLALILLLPLFAAAAGAEDTVIYLSDLDTVKHDLIKSAGITNGINQGLQQKKMSVNGRVFEKGFCTHPVDADNPSVITVDVSRYSTDYPVFHTVMGKDDITKDGGTGLTVVLCIYVDGKEVYMSDLLDLGDVVELYLDVEGAKEIQLLCFAASTFAWLTADFGDTYLCNYKVKEVRLAKAPIKKEYMVGEKLSRVGGVIETEYENGAWRGFKFFSPEDNEGFIQMFRPKEAEGDAYRMKLKGLDANTTYDVRNIDTGVTLTAKGSELMQDGFDVELSPRSTALFTIMKNG